MTDDGEDDWVDPSAPSSPSAPAAACANSHPRCPRSRRAWAADHRPCSAAAKAAARHADRAPRGRAALRRAQCRRAPAVGQEPPQPSQIAREQPDDGRMSLRNGAAGDRSWVRAFRAVWRRGTEGLLGTPRDLPNLVDYGMDQGRRASRPSRRQRGRSAGDSADARLTVSHGDRR